MINIPRSENFVRLLEPEFEGDIHGVIFWNTGPLAGIPTGRAR
jgi:hypothetical protein